MPPRLWCRLAASALSARPAARRIASARRITALVLAQHAQVVQRARQIEIAPSEPLRREGNRTPRVDVRLVVASERPQHARERALGLHAQATDVRIAQPRVARQQPLGALVLLQRLGPAIVQLQRGAHLQQRRRHVRMVASLVALEQGQRPQPRRQRHPMLTGSAQPRGIGVQGDRTGDRIGRNRSSRHRARMYSHLRPGQERPRRAARRSLPVVGPAPLATHWPSPTGSDGRRAGGVPARRTGPRGCAASPRSPDVPRAAAAAG